MVKFRKMLVDNKGFTLIELLVVIAVLGILAAIAIPRLTGFTDRARVSNLQSSGQTIRSNVELYIAENSVAPNASILTSTTSDYYVNLDDEYTLNNTSDTGPDDYSYTLEYNTATGWNVVIQPSGLTINSP